MDSLKNSVPTPVWRKLLRPLVSLFIKNNIHHRQLNLWLKEIYVDVAADEYGKGGRPTNVTRIAMLTGLDRKEVKRIRDAQQSESVDALLSGRATSGVLGRVLSGWYQDEEFSDRGKPRALNTTAEFAGLCKRYGGDVTHTAILTELLRVGSVATLPDGDVVATSRYYMPDRADPEAIARSGDVYHDIGQTLVHNLYRNANQPSRFEGRATNPQVPEHLVDDFRQFVEQRGQSFLEDIDARLSDYEHSSTSNHDTVRVGLGVYWIEDNNRENPK